MSGLEALGLVCNVFQVISFARETITVCQAIYEGQKTPDDALEETTKALVGASEAVRKSNHHPTNDAEKRLNEIAQSCSDAGTRLECEVQKITTLHKKNSLFAALSARMRFVWKKSKIEELDKSFCRYMKTLEALRISDLCDQGKARDLRLSKNFGALDYRLQNLIKAIEAGHTRLEDLLQSEAKTTRDHVTHEFDSERRVAERQRLLRSLKFPGMNERLNNIEPPENATWTRISQAFEVSISPEEPASSSESVDGPEATIECHDGHTLLEVDEIWQTFMDWLQSDNSVFWIQGKPGSGKSTLIKSVIKHKGTLHLLNRWQPNARIIAHFFWMLGSSKAHTNAKGLYLSLLFQIFQEEQHVLESLFPDGVLADKDSDADWSAEDLRQILVSVLGSDERRRPLCIFIDGIDEYRDADGFRGLMARITEISSFNGVKVCLAGRPEVEMRKRLAGKPNLKLHELTWPEMSRWTRHCIASVLSAEQMQQATIHRLIDRLLDKAQGVFLWLRLVVGSVQRGLDQEDPSDVLLQRVDELPNELDELYADMWKRLNSDTRQYRESAALYFRLVIEFNQRHAVFGFNWRMFFRVSLRLPDQFLDVRNLTLLEVLCTKDPRAGLELLNPGEEVDYERLLLEAKRIQQEVMTRTAGMLEIREFSMKRYLSPDQTDTAVMMRGVTFIHRTAQDFLCDTSAGQEILAYSNFERFGLAIDSTEAFMCLARLLWDDLSIICTSDSVFHSLYRTWKSMDDDVVHRQRLLRVVESIVQFHKLGIVCDTGRRYSQIQLLAQMPGWWFSDGSDLSDSLFDIVAQPNADDALRDLLTKKSLQKLKLLPFWARPYKGEKTTAVLGQLIIKLRRLGADSTRIGYARWSDPSGAYFIRRSMALWELASSICFGRFVENHPWDTIYGASLDSVKDQFISMLNECTPETLETRGFAMSPPNSDRPTLGFGQDGCGCLLFRFSGMDGEVLVIPVFEMSLRFLADAAVGRFENVKRPSVLGAKDSATGGSPNIPYLILAKGGRQMRWFRSDTIRPPLSFLFLFFDKSLLNMNEKEWRSGDQGDQWKREYRAWADEIWHLCKSGALEEVDGQEVLNSHPDHLGPCTMESAGLVWSKKVQDYVDEETARELGPPSVKSSSIASEESENSEESDFFENPGLFANSVSGGSSIASSSE